MRIFRSMRPNRITQGFGENLLPWYKQHGMLGHNGIDWACPNGTKLYWDCDIEGTVFRTETGKWGGLGLDIITEDKDGIFKHRYWHLKGFKVKPGDVVESGDLIGLGNNTGKSTGPHLHRGLKRMYRDNMGNLKLKDRGNGYYGGIDQAPYFDNIFILDYLNTLKKKISILKKAIEVAQKIINLILRK